MDLSTAHTQRVSSIHPLSPKQAILMMKISFCGINVPPGLVFTWSLTEKLGELHKYIQKNLNMSLSCEWGEDPL